MGRDITLVFTGIDRNPFPHKTSPRNHALIYNDLHICGTIRWGCLILREWDYWKKERFEITTQHHNAKSLLVSRGVAMALLRSVRKI